MMKHDRLVTTLLWRELRDALDSMRLRDLIWIGIGGAALLAYAAADVIFALLAGAETLRRSAGLWPAGLPSAALLLGLAAGIAATRLALSRAHSPFLRALPLSTSERRRMSVFATVTVGTALTVAIAAFAVLFCMVIEKPHAFLWSAVLGILFAAGYGAGMVERLRRLPSHDLEKASIVRSYAKRTRRVALTPGRLDRARPAWLGAWAWGLPAAELVPTWRVFVVTIAMGLIAVISAATSLVQRQATPGAIAGLTGGLLVFMLGLRCHPLGSPVLRTAPIGFGHVWLRLIWLPLVLSAAFFLLPAGAALAAEPSSWTMPVASGLWLLILNGTYAVFAAYFMTAPLAAAISFLAAIAYTGYESLEYGRTVIIGFAGLVLWLWYRARQRYYHG